MAGETFKSMTTHTKTPWGIERTGSRNWIGPMRSDGRKVSDVVFFNERKFLSDAALARNDANVEFVIQAVNTHDRLVEKGAA